jgi:hypothetical protein
MRSNPGLVLFLVVLALVGVACVLWLALWPAGGGL